MKVLVIGASGHIGSYLVKELIREQHEVYAVMRGERIPYGYDEKIWSKVKMLKMSRDELCESDIFDKTEFDVVCDLIAYSLDSVKKLLLKIKNDIFYIQIGSIWMYGNKVYLPVDERHPKNGLEEYGKQKGLIEEFLFELVKQNKLRATVIHPGHVSGKGWDPINPQGNKDMSFYHKVKNGEEIILPFLGITTLQHVHSYDLANIIIACINKQDVANGEAFNAVCEKAMTNRSLCEYVYNFYGKKSKIRYVNWEEFVETVGERHSNATLDHAIHSPCCSVEKAKNILGVKIRYSITDIFDEYLRYINI